MSVAFLVCRGSRIRTYDPLLPADAHNYTPIMTPIRIPVSINIIL